MSQLRGTVWARPNGTWTVEGERVWNPRNGKFLRPSLGTFATEAEAETAQVTYTDQMNRDLISHISRRTRPEAPSDRGRRLRI